MEPRRSPMPPAASSRPAIGELDRVAVLVPVAFDGGLISAGSVGTVVAVWGSGRAFDVEFVQPVAALVTVTAGQVDAAPPA